MGHTYYEEHDSEEEYDLYCQKVIDHVCQLTVASSEEQLAYWTDISHWGKIEQLDSTVEQLLGYYHELLYLLKLTDKQKAQTVQKNLNNWFNKLPEWYIEQSRGIDYMWATTNEGTDLTGPVGTFIKDKLENQLIPALTNPDQTLAYSEIEILQTLIYCAPQPQLIAILEKKQLDKNLPGLGPANSYLAAYANRKEPFENEQTLTRWLETDTDNPQKLLQTAEGWQHHKNFTTNPNITLLLLNKLLDKGFPELGSSMLIKNIIEGGTIIKTKQGQQLAEELIQDLSPFAKRLQSQLVYALTAYCDMNIKTLNRHWKNILENQKPAYLSPLGQLAIETETLGIIACGLLKQKHTKTDTLLQTLKLLEDTNNNLTIPLNEKEIELYVQNQPIHYSVAQKLTIEKLAKDYGWNIKVEQPKQQPKTLLKQNTKISINIKK